MTVDVYESRTPSITKAEELAESKKYAAVRVIADSDRAGTETVFEKNVKEVGEQPVLLVPIKQAPICKDLVDYYGLESRKTLAKVLRNFLDNVGLSALELLFDRSELVMLERNDAVYPKLMQQLSSAQARVLSVQPVDRADILYAAAEQIKENALKFINEETGITILKEKGLGALLKFSKTKGNAGEAYIFSRHALSRLLNEGGDWNSKIQLAVELGSGKLDPEAIECLDEVLAELLDGAKAVAELLGGQADAASANRVLILLCEGRCPSPPRPISCIVEFNELMGRHSFLKTRMVLHERVAGYLSSTRSLTREGPEKEREAFANVVRDLGGLSGLRGGPLMCASVTQRARIVLSGGEQDLSYSEALTRITDMLPCRGARIGYLLEVFQSDDGKKNSKAILPLMARIVGQLKTLSSLVPDGFGEDKINKAIEGLKAKIASEDLPADWRNALQKTFDILMSKPRSEKDAPTTFSLKDKEHNKMITKAPERKTIEQGEILFQEGDNGSEAYLILSGHVEIYRMVGNKEEVLAKVGRGAIIGEMSLIDNQPRMASARVMEGGQLSVIDQQNLGARLDTLGENDKVLRRLIDVLVDRLRGDGAAFT